MSIRTQKLIYILLIPIFILGLFAVAGSFALAQEIDIEAEVLETTEEYFIEDENGEQIPITKEEFEEIFKDGFEEVTETTVEEFFGESGDTESVADLGLNADEDESLACFEYYPYGQLDISTQLDKDIYLPGDTVVMKLKVTNTNPNTSIKNGKVIIQIRKLIEETNTTVLLSEEVIGSDLIYPKQTTKENDFSFIIPDSLSNGLYHVYIFITDNNFSISGLLFTQDIAGQVGSFLIENSQKENFDIPYFRENEAVLAPVGLSDNISVNPFYPTPDIIPDELPAIITIPVYNPSDDIMRVNLVSSLHLWDETGESFGLKKEELLLDPKGTQNFTFNVPSGLEPGTYMLRTILSSNDNIEIISKVRFSVPGFAPKILYSGIIENDKGENKIFSCIGNATSLSLSFADSEEEDFVKDELFSTQGKTALILSDSNNKEFDRFEYEGGLFNAFAPRPYIKAVTKGLSDNVILKTLIYDKEGNILEESEISYEFEESNYLVYYLAFGALLLLIIFVFIKRKWTNTIDTNISTISKNGISMLIIALIIVSSLIYFGQLDFGSGKTLTEKTKAASSIKDSRFLQVRYKWALPYSCGSGNPCLTAATINFYTDQTIDFLFPSDGIFSGSTFDLTKSNYGQWYSANNNGYWTPLFKFSANSMTAYGTFRICSYRGGGFTCPKRGVTFTLPYTDTWTTSDSKVSCINLNADNARCSVDASFPGGNVDITQTRKITIDGNNLPTPRPGWGGEYLIRKVVPGTPTKSLTTYVMKKRCSGSGRSRRCTTTPAAQNIVISRHMDWPITTYSRTCTTSCSGGRSKTCSTFCRPYYAKTTTSRGDSSVKRITLTKTKTVNISPSSNLSISCSVSPTSVQIDQTTTWTASASGEAPPYTYSWTGTNGLSGTTAVVNKTYTTGGTKTGKVTVGSGIYLMTANCNNSVAVGFPECSDGIDNDGDGLIDEKDPDCWTDPTDPSTYNPNDDNETTVPQCSDGVDNADPEDTLRDTADPGCYDSGAYDPNDTDETDTLPQCSNFFDDDRDGKVDYPYDPGCSSADDDNEVSEPPSISCLPSLVNAGDPFTISWSCVDSTSSTGDENFSTGGAVSGSIEVIASATTYTVFCSNGGQSSCTVTVINPILSISANPTKVRSGGASTITWSVLGVNSCTVTGPNGFFATGLSGSQSTGAIVEESTYTLTCQTDAGQVSDSITIKMLPTFQEF